VELPFSDRCRCRNWASPEAAWNSGLKHYKALLLTLPLSKLLFLKLQFSNFHSCRVAWGQKKGAKICRSPFPRRCGGPAKTANS
jgi:hypothetical protein